MMKKIIFLLPVLSLLFSGCLKRQSSETVTSSPEATEMASDSAELALPNLLSAAQANPELSTALKLIEQAGLSQTLQNMGPFTIFVPTNEAFEAYPAEELAALSSPENKSKLIRLLTYHVVPGLHTEAEFTDQKKLKTIQGQDVTITQVRNDWRLTDSAGTTATIDTSTKDASNGVLFVIDSVLSPR